MKGAVFITHAEGWSCSNEAVLDFHSFTERDMSGKIIAVSRTQTLTVSGIFNAFGLIPEHTKCDIVMLDEDDQKKYGFTGELRSIGQEVTVLNIFTKTDRISEILSNITPKKIGG